jgi:hypothetical protein
MGKEIDLFNKIKKTKVKNMAITQTKKVKDVKP